MPIPGDGGIGFKQWGGVAGRLAAPDQVLPGVAIVRVEFQNAFERAFGEGFLAEVVSGRTHLEMPAGIVFTLMGDGVQLDDGFFMLAQIIVGARKQQRQLVTALGRTDVLDFLYDLVEFFFRVITVQPSDQGFSRLSGFILFLFVGQTGNAPGALGGGIVGRRQVVAEYAFTVLSVVDGVFQGQEFIVARNELQPDFNGITRIVFLSGMVLHAGELQPAPRIVGFDSGAFFADFQGFVVFALIGERHRIAVMPDAAMDTFAFDSLEPFFRFEIGFVSIQIVEGISGPECCFEVFACAIEIGKQADDALMRLSWSSCISV